MTNTFFEIETCQLYEKAKKDVVTFIREPIEDNLFNALFSLKSFEACIRAGISTK